MRNTADLFIPMPELDHLTVAELSQELSSYIYQEINYVGDGFRITKLCLVGSRVKSTAKADSDLDVAFQYEGKYRADVMCDVLNETPLYINDLRVDFLPYSEHKGNRIDDALPLIELSVSAAQ